MKDLDHKNGVQRHHVFPRDVSHGLTPRTSFGKGLGILKKSGPVESTIQHFCSSLFPWEVAPACKSMAEIQDAMMFSFGGTSPNDIVCTHPEEFWVLPNVILVLREKSFSLLFCPPMRHLTYNFEVDYVYKPREVGMRYCQKLFIQEGLLDRFTF